MDRTNWLDWWPVAAAVLTMIGGAIAWTSGMVRQRGTDQQERQKAREEAATKDAGQTFKNASDLIDQYQEALKAQREEILEVKQQCVTDLAALRARADETERRLLERIGTLERQVASLQAECSALRMQL